MKYKFKLCIGFAGAEREEEFTSEELGIEENLTPEQIEKILEDELGCWAADYIDMGWQEIKDNQQ